LKPKKQAIQLPISMSTLSIPKAILRNEIATATAEDETLKQIVKALMDNKFPENGLVKAYSGVWSELCVSDDGIVLKSNQIVLPTSLVYRCLKTVHEAHLGITKTIGVLQEKVWFPEMRSKVERLIKSCSACQAVTAKEHHEPVQASEMPEEPWQNLSIDL
jgi:hypothetical protein